jgi:hypothetical protein
MAPALLSAVEKYLLDHLKTRCEKHLIRQMSAKNCLMDLLVLTTPHPAEYLKKYAIEYFRRYPSEFTLHTKIISLKKYSLFNHFFLIVCLGEVMGTDNWIS